MASRLEVALRDFVDGDGSVETLRAAAREEARGGLGDSLLELLDRYENGDWSENELRNQARGLIIGA